MSNQGGLGHVYKASSYGSSIDSCCQSGMALHHNGSGRTSLHQQNGIYSRLWLICNGLFFFKLHSSFVASDVYDMHLVYIEPRATPGAE